MFNNPICEIDKMIFNFRFELQKFIEVEVLYCKDVEECPFDIAKYEFFKYFHSSGLYKRYLNIINNMINYVVTTFNTDLQMAESLIGLDLDVEILNCFENSWNLSVNN